MKTPSFWYKSNPFLEAILSPFSAGYQGAQSYVRAQAHPQKVKVPVISVGNITAGGSGKTPTALAISALVQSSQLFLNPHFVTRGYGGKILKPELVTDQTPFLACGDEAKLLSARARTIVARNRYDGALYAQDVGADVIILDDGLQNRHLKADLSFCVIDGFYGLGNEKLLPAGPLREPVRSALARTDAIILIGDDRTHIAKRLPRSMPLFHANAIPDTRAINPTSLYFAFCGLGIPQKFYQTLVDLSLPIIDTQDFADHYIYTSDDIDQLIAKAKANSARLITTEKDFVKIKNIYDDVSMIDVLPISLTFQDEASFLQFLKKGLSPL